MYIDYEKCGCDHCLNKLYYGENISQPYHYWTNAPTYDYGPYPYVLNIEKAAERNKNFRTTLWTGKNLQLTLMSIRVGGDVGLEVHHKHDQFVRIEEGDAIVKMGNRKNNLDFQRRVDDDFAFIVPAGTWHNLINIGTKPLKVSSIYAPPEHLPGTIDKARRSSEYYG